MISCMISESYSASGSGSESRWSRWIMMSAIQVQVTEYAGRRAAGSPKTRRRTSGSLDEAQALPMVTRPLRLSLSPVTVTVA